MSIIFGFFLVFDHHVKREEQGRGGKMQKCLHRNQHSYSILYFSSMSQVQQITNKVIYGVINLA